MYITAFENIIFFSKAIMMLTRGLKCAPEIGIKSSIRAHKTKVTVIALAKTAMLIEASKTIENNIIDDTVDITRNIEPINSARDSPRAIFPVI